MYAADITKFNTFSITEKHLPVEQMFASYLTGNFHTVRLLNLHLHVLYGKGEVAVQFLAKHRGLFHFILIWVYLSRCYVSKEHQTETTQRQTKRHGQTNYFADFSADATDKRNKY